VSIDNPILAILNLRWKKRQKQPTLPIVLINTSNLASVVNFYKTLWWKRRLQFYHFKFSTTWL
jgi:hypothetical protein